MFIYIRFKILNVFNYTKKKRVKFIEKKIKEEKTYSVGKFFTSIFFLNIRDKKMRK